MATGGLHAFHHLFGGIRSGSSFGRGAAGAVRRPACGRLTPVAEPDRPAPHRLHATHRQPDREICSGTRNAAGFYVADIGGPYAVAPRLDVDELFGATWSCFTNIRTISCCAIFRRLIRHGLSRAMPSCSPPRASKGRLDRPRPFPAASRLVVARRAAGAARHSFSWPAAGAQLGISTPTAWALTHYLLIADDRPGQLHIT